MYVAVHSALLLSEGGPAPGDPATLPGGVVP